jgi:hypothetical protein
MPGDVRSPEFRSVQYHGEYHGFRARPGSHSRPPIRRAGKVGSWHAPRPQVLFVGARVKKVRGRIGGLLPTSWTRTGDLWVRSVSG